MNVAVGWPVLAMPKKSVIGAAPAAIVLASARAPSACFEECRTREHDSRATHGGR